MQTHTEDRPRIVRLHLGEQVRDVVRVRAAGDLRRSMLTTREWHCNHL